MLPCNQLLQQTVNERKFVKSSDAEYICSLLTEEKQQNPQQIPYYFSCCENQPQYLLLQYVPSKNDLVKEYIKVKPQGNSLMQDFSSTASTSSPSPCSSPSSRRSSRARTTSAT